MNQFDIFGAIFHPNHADFLPSNLAKLSGLKTTWQVMFDLSEFHYANYLGNGESFAGQSACYPVEADARFLLEEVGLLWVPSGDLMLCE